MKKIIYILLLFTAHTSLAQGTTILPTGMQNYTIKNISGKGYEQINNSTSFGTWINSSNAYIQTSTFHSFFIGLVAEGVYGMFFKTNGNVSSTNWLKLGSDAPEIFIYKYSGTTSSAIGGSTVIPISSTTSRVLSASIMIDCGAAGYVTDNYSFTDGYQVQFIIENNTIRVQNVLNNSDNILSKPFEIILTIKKP
jgi:hypothetical protein